MTIFIFVNILYARAHMYVCVCMYVCVDIYHWHEIIKLVGLIGSDIWILYIRRFCFIISKDDISILVFAKIADLKVNNVISNVIDCIELEMNSTIYDFVACFSRREFLKIVSVKSGEVYLFGQSIHMPIS